MEEWIVLRDKLKTQERCLNVVENADVKARKMEGSLVPAVESGSQVTVGIEWLSFMFQWLDCEENGED